MKNIDVLVIGAGPSGTVAASYLVNQGYTVTIVERTQFPRFVIGESLLPLSMGHYEQTGLLPALEEKNFEVKAGALFIRGEKEFRITFDDNFTPGWTWAWQVPRADFDKTLADETEKKGVEILYKSTISDLDFSGDGVHFTANTPSGDVPYHARFVIDSSGYGGVLTKMLNIPTHVSPTSNMAVYTHIDDNTYHLTDTPMQISFDILETELWFWVIPFNNGVTSLGFVGNREKYFSQFEGENVDVNAEFMKLIAKSKKFANRFKDVELKFTPHVHRDYTRHSDSFFGDKYVLTGNTTEFLDPVFSSGVAFATESGFVAAQLVARQLKGEQIDWQKEYVDHLSYGINVFRTYVKEWYTGNLQKIFFHVNINPLMKKQLTSVLAGYVWDDTNPFVKKHDTIIRTLAQVVDIEKMAKAKA
jgi:flavin-dependent dehydrogenase